MLILTHIGENLPHYLNDFLFQFRKINKNYDVVFLTNRVNINNEIFINMLRYRINIYASNPIILYNSSSVIVNITMQSHEKKLLLGRSGTRLFSINLLVYLLRYTDFNERLNSKNSINTTKIKTLYCSVVTICCCWSLLFLSSI